MLRLSNEYNELIILDWTDIENVFRMSVLNRIIGLSEYRYLNFGFLVI